MKRLGIAMSALLLLSLTGCSGGQSADDAFVSTVRESVDVPAVEQATDSDLIGLGKAVCQTLKDDGFEDGLPRFIDQAAGYGIGASDAGGIAGSAVGAYCPEFSDSFTG